MKTYLFLSIILIAVLLLSGCDSGLENSLEDEPDTGDLLPLNDDFDDSQDDDSQDDDFRGVGPLSALFRLRSDR